MSIEIDHVSVTLQNNLILKDISLNLSEKKIGIIGANGSGKSTFLKLLNALQLPTKGSVRIFGKDSRKETQFIRRSVGFIFQNPDNQVIMPIVEEDLSFGLKNLKIEKKERERRVSLFLETYNLEHLKKRQIHFLSGGQKQLLAFGSILVMQPKILVCDEPITQLDYLNSQKIKKLLNDLDFQIIVSSHDFSIFENFDRVIVFHEGEIIFDGKPKEAIFYYLEKSKKEL